MVYIIENISTLHTRSESLRLQVEVYLILLKFSPAKVNLLQSFQTAYIDRANFLTLALMYQIKKLMMLKNRTFVTKKLLWMNLAKEIYFISPLALSIKIVYV